MPPRLPPRLAAAVDAFDARVDEWVEGVRSPALDPIFYGLSSAADHSILWHVTGALRALRRHGSLEDVARMSAAMGIESFVTNVAVKSLFARGRPEREAANEGGLDRRYALHTPVTSSFPSGHAAAAFCAATLLTRDAGPRRGWYALAALVATSRVYVRLHHGSDVVAGAVLGTALGYALRPLVRPLPGRARARGPVRVGRRGCRALR